MVRGLRDVIEKRVNILALQNQGCIRKKLVLAIVLWVELAGIKDVNQAIKMIGQTPFLEFREVLQDEKSTSSVSFLQLR